MSWPTHVSTPTLMLDRAKCRANIERMALRAAGFGVRLRPHFKTHQSREVGGWFKDFGVTGIAVSSVEMAAYFADSGFGDITVAFPVNPREIARINEVAERVRLNLLVESPETVAALADGLEGSVGVFVKIDTGYGRTGIPHGETGRVEEVLRAAEGAARLDLLGLLTHAGHSYAAGDPDGIHAVHHHSLAAIAGLKGELGSSFEQLEVSVGDTPTCSLAGSFEGVDEMRPGNFVFYDAMQVGFGTCELENVAVALACPVVAVHQERNEIIVHGGAVHLSKEFLEEETGSRSYGPVVEIREDGWSGTVPGARMAKLSQEHGTVSAPADFCDRVRVGDLLGVLPVHSCLTANLMGAYVTLEGEGVDHFSGVGRF